MEERTPRSHCIECSFFLTVPAQLPHTFRVFLLECLKTYSDRAFISAPLIEAPITNNAASSCALQEDGPREEVTYGEVLRKSLVLAAWLRSEGVGMGSRVAIGGANCIEQVFILSVVWIDAQAKPAVGSYRL
jgi:hypothetical protein